MMQICTHVCGTQVSGFRKLVDGKIGDKHEEVMSRMGAIMAAGILDAGTPGFSAFPAVSAGYCLCMCACVSARAQ